MEKTKTSPCPDNKSSQVILLIRFIIEHLLWGSLRISTAGGTAYMFWFPAPEVLAGYSHE